MQFHCRSKQVLAFSIFRNILLYMEEWSNLFGYLEQALKAAYVDYDCAKAIRMFLL